MAKENITKRGGGGPYFIKREERVAKYGNVRWGFEVQ